MIHSKRQPRPLLPKRQARKAATRAREAEIQLAIEATCREQLPEKLRLAIEQALEHGAEIVASLPGPVEVTRSLWSSDPRLRAFFTGVEDMRQVLSDNREVHDFFCVG